MKLGIQISLCILVLVASALASATSVPLAPNALYQRCYVRMVRKPLPPNDPTLLQVQSGALSPDAACLSLFDRAAFQPSTGKLKSFSDGDAIEIVKTFHALHRSFFQSRAFATTSGNTFQMPTALVQDMEEPALYYTRSAFLENTRFDSIVTLNSGLKGVRSRSDATLNRFQSQRFVSANSAMPYAQTTSFIISYGPNSNIQAMNIPDETLMDTGALMGVAPQTPLIVPLLVTPGSSDKTTAAAIKSASINYDVRKHLGGGILGSQGFFMSNLNLGQNVLPDSEASINRRISARVYQDLLCHELPTLQTNDVAQDVQPSSPYPFRHDSSCMRCHSSLDPLAYGFRNSVLVATSTFPQAKINEVGWPVLTQFVIPSTAGSSSFNTQPATGTLHYRELMTGKEVKADFASFSDAGQTLAAGADLYTCAAKRYYKFFTGIDVPLAALDPSSATYTIDVIHQNKVIELGQKLKASQSVRTLLGEIFKSDAFRSSNYLSEVPKGSK